MFLTVHAIFALLFIKIAPNIVWAFIIGFVSHFVLDMIPHGDKEARGWSDELKIRRLPGVASIDTLFLLITWYLIHKSLNLPIEISFFLIFGAVLPDIIQGIYMALAEHPFNNKFTKFHFERVHYLLTKNLLSMEVGIFIQLFILLASIYLLTLFYK